MELRNKLVSHYSSARSVGIVLLFLLSISPAVVAAEPAGGVEQTQNYFPVEKVYLARGEEADTWKLDVEVERRARCMFGDLDLVQLDLERSAGSKKLQLSLESMGVSTPKVILASSTERAESGNLFRRFSFILPRFEKPTLLGLYLCSTTVKSDEKGGSSVVLQPCSTKQLISFEEASRPYRVDKSKAIGADGKLQAAPLLERRSKASGDKIYFFRFVIAAEDYLLVPTQEFDEPTYAQLGAFLKSISAEVEDPEKLIARLKELGKVVGSIPTKVRSKKVVVTLPYYSRKKCLG